MAFPVLTNELVLLLRRPWLFLAMGIVFLTLTFFAAVLSRAILTDIHRDEVCRNLFYILLVVGYIGFSFHSGRIAAQSTGKERDRGTSVFLRTAPIRGWSVVAQKMAMALIVEWFVFIGLLPFIALLFLIGGLSATEFLYQLTGLVVWINTCVMIGLAAGMRVRNPATAVRDALTRILSLAGLPLALMHFLSELRRYIPADSILSTIRDGLQTLFQFLSVFSPAWVIGNELDGPFLSPLLTHLGVSFTRFVLLPEVPALSSWLLHLGLQLLLFLYAIRSWKKVGEEARVPRTEVEEDSPTKRKLHGVGWRAFYRQERKQSFVAPRGTRFFLALFILAGSVAGTYLTGVELPAVTACFVLISLIAVIFISQGAFGREVRRGTAPLLLISPAPRREIVLGKWLFYQSVGIRLLLPGLAYTCALIVRAEYYAVPNAADIWSHLTYYFLAATALPLAAMIGVLMGLTGFPLYYALPIGIGAVCLFPVTIVLFIGWIFQQLMATVPDENETEVQHGRRLKSATGILTLFAIFSVILGIGMGVRPADPTFRRATGETLLLLNAAVVLPSVGVALWIWLSNQPESWWKEKLLPSEFPYASLARNFEFLRTEAKRNARYKAHILRMAALKKSSDPRSYEPPSRA